MLRDQVLTLTNLAPKKVGPVAGWLQHHAWVSAEGVPFPHHSCPPLNPTPSPQDAEDNTQKHGEQNGICCGIDLGCAKSMVRHWKNRSAIAGTLRWCHERLGRSGNVPANRGSLSGEILTYGWHWGKKHLFLIGKSTNWWKGELLVY